MAKLGRTLHAALLSLLQLAGTAASLVDPSEVAVDAQLVQRRADEVSAKLPRRLCIHRYGRIACSGADGVNELE